MKLRPLGLQDAEKMLEWMHDPECVQNLQANFADKTLDDCQRFIASTFHDKDNLHLAIADENDDYMGTVSLKYIDRERKSAEFAIAIRSCAMGKGYSAQGMKLILQKGFEELGLKTIYWCVSPKNARAVRFYDKNNYPRVAASTLFVVGYSPEQMAEYIWYAVKE